MTILSGFDTHDPDYKTGHFICPRCGMIDVVDTMEVKPASDGLDERYLDIKMQCGYEIPDIADLQINICSNCGMMWIDNEGNYSTSQLISYLFTSLSDILTKIKGVQTGLDPKGSADAIMLLGALQSFYTDNSCMVDFEVESLNRIKWLLTDFKGQEMADYVTWLNFLLKGAAVDDIVDIYNSWITSLGKRAAEFGCAPVSGKVDTATTPYIDEVIEPISSDNMEILNDE
ncbi:MAG: hypothetical protein J6Y02_04540 [Pseudobutyrivibrio sp.]|nr:hypothetical protein [Pseudobutyrivibrio sp.]